MKYNERKQARIERYKQYSKNADNRSQDAFNTARGIIEQIPAGQPILIGHHSESSHRNALKRHDNNMRKGFDESKKSDYWADRAKSAENNTNIYDNDPEAVEKIKARIDFLEKRQECYKEINKKLRKAKIDCADDNKADKLRNIGFNDKEVIAILSWNKYEYKEILVLPSFLLTNNNGNLNRLRKRLIYLEQNKSQFQTIDDVKTEKGYITKNEEHNGIEIHFPDKPDQVIIDKLKMHGFRWSRYNKCWYKKYNEYNYKLAKEIIQ